MSAVINAVTTAGEKSMGQSDGSLVGHCVVRESSYKNHLTKRANAVNVKRQLQRGQGLFYQVGRFETLENARPR
jgi:hypothetical protein